jgi:protocatechuate 3,4-dioxygenase beta subunit
MRHPTSPSRRALLQGAAATGAALLLGACSSDADTSRSAGTAPRSSTGPPRPSLPPTPACHDGDEPTPAQTAGPFFTPNSPEKASFLADGRRGTKLVVSGAVLTTMCQPAAGALLDFWQADSDGNYDDEGYRLRGHQFADGEGRFRLETIVPGLYPGRTRHLHVNVQRAGGNVLTTQLYFPREPENDSDTIFRPECLMDVRDGGSGKTASFTFVTAI